MKIIYKKFEVGGEGKCKMIPEIPEDFWHLYNLLAVGDTVHGLAFRKADKREGDKARKEARKKVYIGVVAEAIDFDSEACTVRVRGRNVTENKFIPLGSYHSLELAKNRSFELVKDVWDKMHVERLKEAADPSRSADVAAVILSQGVASVCLIGSHMTSRKEKIEVNIPKKRLGSTTRHDKGYLKFFKLILESITKHVNFEVVKCCIIASPAFFKDDFYKYLIEEAVRQDLKYIMENKHKFLLVHSSSGHMGSLKEILLDASVTSQLEDTKAARDVRVLNNFYSMLQKDESRAFYAYVHVNAAADVQAIDHLMVLDGLFRAADHKQRTLYVNLVEKCKEMGARVHIFSSAHQSGKQLGQLSGIAAILRFPCPDILEIEIEEESDDSS